MKDSWGYVLEDAYLDRETCRSIIDAVAAYREIHPLQEIRREVRGRSLCYSVIDGLEIRDSLPAIWELYTGRVHQLVRDIAGEDMAPLANTQVGVNVNVMPPGRSEYRWHYDRTAVTAVIYLNQVEAGETELYPGLRFLLADQQRVRTQKALDWMVRNRLARAARSKKVVVEPKPGRALVMESNRCWHSVRGVEGTQDRINMILAYDVEGATFPAENDLNAYLYTMEETTKKDPNYAG